MTCRAQCEEPPGYWHTHTCPRNATTQRESLPLCAQHARMAEKRPHLISIWRKGPK